MADNEELHPLVQLLLERIKSHPEEFAERHPNEEFNDTSFRWSYAINTVRDCGSEAEVEALTAALRAVRLDKVHEWALDELLNGPQRRAEERQREEAEQRRWAQAKLAQAQIVSAPTGTMGATTTGIAPMSPYAQAQSAVLQAGLANAAVQNALANTNALSTATGVAGKKSFLGKWLGK